MSFAAQAQYTRVQYGDSIYGNKVKFNRVEYTVPSGDAFLTEVSDLFWVPTSTITSHSNRFSSQVEVTVSPLSGDAPSGISWSDWWSGNITSASGSRRFLEDSSFRLGDEVILSTGEEGIRSTTFILSPRFIENRSGVHFNRDDVTDGDRVYVWRWSDGVLLWNLPNR